MQIKDAMTGHPDIIDPNTTIRDAARHMRQDNVGALPVGEGDRLIGMVTDRDIAMRAVADEQSPGNTTVRQVMSERVYYCFEDDECSDAARVMADHQVHRLPVLNRDKRLVGIIATADLARHDCEALDVAMRGICEATETPRR